MRDFLSDIGPIVIASIFAFLIGTGIAATKSDELIAKDCDRFGLAKLGDAMYVCEKRK